MTSNGHVIVRHIERANDQVLEGLKSIDTATLHEAIGRRGSLGVDLQPIQRDAHVVGSAVTVLSHPGDNLMLHAAIEVVRPGDVLVVATTAPSTHGMFGELLATSLIWHGVIALVMDAGVRDTSELRRMGFPVWSRHVSVQGTVKSTGGSINIPIVIGGQIIMPGDVICADDDGVVVLTRADGEWALERAKARLAKEAATRQKLRNGELGLDFYQLRDTLAEAGVRYVDSADDL